MDIATVKTNLERTIAGKVEYLKTLKSDLVSGDHALPREAHITLVQMIELNINELRMILNDVVQCKGAPSWTPMNCPYAAAETCHRVG